jgi:DNA mismatch repair protein MutL
MAVSPQVQILDINTANQIAAGEVVERPASVVKELVENALDAGATQIDVTAYAGGIEYIRVTDNGCGMSEANARLAILRHATSKIVKAEDLLQLHTLGFRGEALPSIASVANFTLLTRPADEDMATSIKIDGGENMEVGSTGAAAGTTILVENLFFNVPARRKFLKMPATEGRYISELLTKLALSRPDVRFRLLNNDKEVLHTPGDGDLKGTIRALYGRDVAQELLEVDYTDDVVRITGFIGKPTLLKSTRQWQTLFVNGRSIGSKMLAKAIDHAYQSQIPKSGFPFAVLNMRVDTASVDVNVHPQKSEIKFSDEGCVYRAMFHALTEALTKPMSAQKTTMTLLPDSELNVYVQKASVATQERPPLHASLSAQNSRPQNAPVAAKPAFRMGGEQIFKTPEADAASEGLSRAETAPAEERVVPVPEEELLQAQKAPREPRTEEQNIWQAEPTVYDARQETVLAVHEARAESEQNAPAATRETIAFTDADSGMATIWPIGQVDKTFIIAQSEDTLYLIDQHAAHERILYDKLVAAHEHVPAQQLLIPLYIDLQPDDISRIEERREEFLKLGVDAEAGGERILRVSCLPTDIKAEDAESYIQEIAKMLGELREPNAGDLRQEVLHMTACKAAIKAGQLLTMRQMRQLIIELCNTTHPFTCPHGRPCMIAIDSDQLYKMFKRTGF